MRRSVSHEHASRAISAIYGYVARDKTSFGAEGAPRPYRGIPCLQAGVTQNGFTFIELAVTLTIISVLALVAVPMAQLEIQRSKERELRTALFEIREAIDSWKRAVDQGRIATAEGESGYPPSLNALVEGVKDQSSPSGAMLHFLRRLPHDPMLPRNQASTAKPWGLRSHASPPDVPAEGDDVFDVYSTSGRVGLNGVPYRDW